MKVSIITVVYNGENYIQDCIRSVFSQTHKDIEYIVVDGGSTDSTLTLLRPFRNQITHFISEKDHGVYDAMNKGLELASGEVIAFLNSDDFYTDNRVIERVVESFEQNNCECVFANLVYISANSDDKVVRFYNSKGFCLNDFRIGDAPPHPTFFAKRELFIKFGKFDPSYVCAGDYDLMMRFLYIHKASYYHLDETIVKMRQGGISTANFIDLISFNKEKYRSCLQNKIKTNYFYLYSRYFYKIFQLVRR